VEEKGHNRAEAFLEARDWPESSSEEFARFAERLAGTMDRNPRVREAATEVLDWAKSRSVDDQTHQAYRRLGVRESELGEGATPGLGLAVSMMYATVAPALADEANRERLTQRLDDPTLSERIRNSLAELEPDFLGKMMLEGAKRRSQDEGFDRSIQRAHRELKEKLPKLPKVRLDKGDRQIWIAIAIPTWLALGLIGLILIILIVWIWVG
jgi:hypothetical protein